MIENPTQAVWGINLHTDQSLKDSWMDLSGPRAIGTVCENPNASANSRTPGTLVFKDSACGMIPKLATACQIAALGWWTSEWLCWLASKAFLEWSSSNHIMSSLLLFTALSLSLSLALCMARICWQCVSQAVSQNTYFYLHLSSLILAARNGSGCRLERGEGKHWPRDATGLSHAERLPETQTRLRSAKKRSSSLTFRSTQSRLLGLSCSKTHHVQPPRLLHHVDFAKLLRFGKSWSHAMENSTGTVHVEWRTSQTFS